MKEKLLRVGISKCLDGVRSFEILNTHYCRNCLSLGLELEKSSRRCDERGCKANCDTSIFVHKNCVVLANLPVSVG